MDPEIPSTSDKIFCHFRPIFALLPPPPQPSKNPKNQNFEKMIKNPGDIIILHKCTINEQGFKNYTDRSLVHLEPNTQTTFCQLCLKAMNIVGSSQCLLV